MILWFLINLPTMQPLPRFETISVTPMRSLVPLDTSSLLPAQPLAVTLISSSRWTILSLMAQKNGMLMLKSYWLFLELFSLRLQFICNNSWNPIFFLRWELWLMGSNFGWGANNRRLFLEMSLLQLTSHTASSFNSFFKKNIPTATW